MVTTERSLNVKTFSPDHQTDLDANRRAQGRGYSPMRFITDGARRRSEQLEPPERSSPQPSLDRGRVRARTLWWKMPQLSTDGQAQARRFASHSPVAASRARRDHRELLGRLTPVLRRVLAAVGRTAGLGLRLLWCALVWLAATLARPFAQARAARQARRARRRRPALAFPDSLSLARRSPQYARPAVGEQLLGMVPLLLSASVVGAAIVTYNSSIPRLFSGAKTVVAPRVTDRSFEEAFEAGRTQGIAVELAGSRPTDDVPKGIVIAQDPRPDSRLPAGEPIRVTVSAGLRPPNLIGKTLDEARVALIVGGWGVNPQVDTRVTNGSPPNVVIEQQPDPSEAVAQKGTVKLVLAAPNLAYGMSVVKGGGGTAPEAVDGQPGTVAWITGMPNWVEVSFNGPTHVAQVNLLLAQEKEGRSTVELWGWDASGKFFPLHLFNEETADNAVLSVKLPNPASNLVRLRVATTAAPSPIGWREITVVSGQ
jgi:hypothetical protein